MAQEIKDIKTHLALQDAQNKKLKETNSLIQQQNVNLKSAETNWVKSGKQAGGYRDLMKSIEKDIKATTKAQTSQLGEQRRLSGNVLKSLSNRLKESQKLTKEYGKTGVAIGKAWNPKVIDQFEGIYQDFQDRLNSDEHNLNDVRAEGLATALNMYDDVLANATNIGDEEFKIIDVNKILAGIKRDMAR